MAIPDAETMEGSVTRQQTLVPVADEYLEGVEAIAAYLGWNIRKVRYARETGALPIRVKHGIGLYAFKSELLAALKSPDTLGRKDHSS
jgi:hypothetical protein